VQIKLVGHARWVSGLLTLIVLLGATLALYRLEDKSLWSDEITTAAIVVQSPSAIVESLKEIHNAPPLYYFISHAFTYLGTSEFFLRLPSVIFAVLGICVIYHLAVLFYDRATGLLAALLLAIAPFYVEYAQEARMYTLFCLLSLLSLFFFYQAYETGRGRFWAGYALVTSASALVHYMTIMYVVIQGVFLVGATLGRWVPHRNDRNVLSQLKRTWVGFLLSGLTMLLLNSPWLPFALARTQGTGFRLNLSWSQVLSTVAGGYGAMVLPLLGLFFAVGIAVDVAPHWDRRLLAMLWVVLPLPLTLRFLVAAQSIFVSRYIIYVLPVILITVAAGMIATGSWLTRHDWLSIALGGKLPATTLLLVGMGAGFAFVAAQSLSEYYSTPKEDWRGVAQYLQHHTMPGDVVIADGFGYITRDEGRTVISLGYYLDASELDVRFAGVRKLNRSWISGGDTPAVWGVIFHGHPVETTSSMPAGVTHRIDFHWLSIFDATAIDDPLSAMRALFSDLLSWQRDKGGRFDLLVALSKVSAWQGELGSAIAYLDEARQLMPHHEAAYQTVSDGWLALAGIYAGQNEYEQGIEAAREALTYQPDEALAHRILGDCYSGLGIWDQAEAEYLTAQSLSPSLGEQAWFQDRLQRTSSALEGASADYWKQVGDAAWDQGWLEEAAAAFERAVEMQPETPRLFFRLCRTYLKLGTGYQAEMLSSCQQAVTLDPSQAWYRVLLGDALRWNERPDQALAAYRQAVRLEPAYEREGWYHIRLGDAYRLSGELAQAREAYEKALEFDSVRSEAEQRLTELQP
jgi:tetratricopeptide (TPR) repeat protein/4-amino-4-deoxy-L-arabinose transferase-like glycosyltransferase